ncbi:MAG TPA: hypothetical protein DEG17_14390 [Cyanobacteria bacterium UBA11149]|nr:hypothetical protein [Cyanobacteria bacterium UBA11367]HBE60854.1 hypothetical protein [Cyanobacteria bacterium UBA11366]HBK64206.1 hypothetical protein [Cyanobacteria bacterium UBA11166]HBR72189.1 hypothetical protein [Cyanobacteria bacterium UBA11159]HBS69765.1 hypothetical protein [Cyanobacteria bacterium UBA11153]HBW90026.1 hypothetical protein [Cyanobacteria bacterium UBA11149]
MKPTILTTATLFSASISASIGAIAFMNAPWSISHAENLEHTQQLLSTKACAKCNLTGAGLVVADLGGANLSGADLSRANLSRANLMGADLTQANLTGASLNGANLAGANLSGAILDGTDLRDAYLVNAQLFGTNLNRAYIQGTIGIPAYAGTPEDFYAWGVIEAEKGNYRAAIENYNQAISLKPDFAPAFLARGIALLRLSDEVGANRDAQIASKLFTEQGNQAGYQASQNLVRLVEIALNPPKARDRGSLGNALLGIGSLLLRFLGPF